MVKETAKKTRTHQMVRRTPSVPKARFEALQLARTAATKRAKQAAAQRVGTLVGGLTGYGIGYLEQKGHKLPTLGGLEPTLLAGLVLAFGPTLLGAGNSKVGQVAAEIGASALGVAGYKAGLGQPMVSGDYE